MIKLKRFSSLVLCVLMVMSMLAVCQISVAYADTAGDFEFTVVDETAVITKYLGNDTTVTIPAKLNDYPVAEIGTKAFYNNTNIETLTGIPATVTVIGAGAFSGCTNLSSISLPSALTKIGDGAFINCASLKTVTVPDKVTKIGVGVFSGCTALETLSVPFVGLQAGQDGSFAELFDGKQKPNYPATLKNITVTKDDSVDDGAFAGLTALQTLNWKTNPTYIGTKAFYGCENLENLTLAFSGVSAVNDYAFYGCKKLDNISLPAKTTKIGAYAFYGCEALGSFTANKALKIVGKQALHKTKWFDDFADGNVAVANVYYAFKGLADGQKISIPEGITSIADQALQGHTDVKEITVANSVTYIGTEVLKGCDKLEKLTIPFIGKTANEEDTMFLAYFFGGDDKSSNKTFLPATLKTIVLTAVQQISAGVLQSAKYITNVTIPESVTAIKEEAFASCPALKTVYYNAQNATVSPDAFNNTNITAIVFGDTVKTIPTYLCTGNAMLKAIRIPASVTAIKERAFAGCYNITALQFNARNCTSVAADTFDYCHKLTDIVLGDEVEYIPANLFSRYGGSGLTELTVPESVKTIDAEAFKNCTALKTVYFNAAECTIGNAAFAACANLEKIVLGKKVTKLPTNLYTGNTKLTAVTLPEQITQIEDYAFEGCSALASVSVGSSVTKVGTGIMNNTKWYNLQKDGRLYLDYIFLGRKGSYTDGDTVRIENGTTVIADRAFAGIGVGFTVFMPNSIQSFSKDLFENSAKASISCYESNTAVIDLAQSYGISCTAIPCADTDVYYVIVKPATVSVAGQADVYCFDCGQKINSVMYTVGQLNDEYVQTTAPSCMENGAAVKVNGGVSKVIPCKGHGETIWKEAKAATCTETGKKIGYCKDCNASRYSDVIQKIDHKIGAWTTKTNATTYHCGEMARCCTACGEVLASKKIDKLELTNVMEQFTDVAENDWFYDTVNFAVVNGFFNGVGDNEFAPNESMTRAMFVTVLYRLAGSPSVKGFANPFTDVKSSSWYGPAIKWAAHYGVVNGVAKAKFCPNDPITREQICVIIVRYCNQVESIDLTVKGKTATLFRDADLISSYALQAVLACQNAGIVNGKADRYFDPLGKATRAEVAQVLKNLAEKFLAE